MNIWIFGGKGKTGKALKRQFPRALIFGSVCDVSSQLSISESLPSSIRPDIIINCAAITSLERCEKDKHHAFNVNVNGALNLLSLSDEYNAKYIHISSGCLFDGNEKPNTEESTPTPSVWYTNTKKWADELIVNSGYKDYLILRPRQIFSRYIDDTNMLDKFKVKQEIFAHQEPNSGTCLEDFVNMVSHLISIDAKGIYNCTNDGLLNPYQVAKFVSKYINPQLRVYKASYQDVLDKYEIRRVNTILDNSKLNNTGYRNRDVLTALISSCREYEKI